MQNSFYTNEEIKAMGFKSFGENVLISRFARFYSPEKMEFGNNVRIDDFCILSGNIMLGNYIHISAYTSLYGRFGIEINDFSGLSPRCTIFSATDDFSGEFMIGPLINSKNTNVVGGKVTIHKHCQLGCNCVILPDVEIKEGVAVGAMSLVLNDLESWGIYKGIPATYLKKRSKKLLDFDLNV
jgi:acetyltransferase-like isoleucine patch superfamily enzyme